MYGWMDGGLLIPLSFVRVPPPYYLPIFLPVSKIKRRSCLRTPIAALHSLAFLQLLIRYIWFPQLSRVPDYATADIGFPQPTLDSHSGCA